MITHFLEYADNEYNDIEYNEDYMEPYLDEEEHLDLVDDSFINSALLNELNNKNLEKSYQISLRSTLYHRVWLGGTRLSPTLCVMRCGG